MFVAEAKVSVDRRRNYEIARKIWGAKKVKQALILKKININNKVKI